MGVSADLPVFSEGGQKRKRKEEAVTTRRNQRGSVGCLAQKRTWRHMQKEEETPATVEFRHLCIEEVLAHPVRSLYK